MQFDYWGLRIVAATWPLTVDIRPFVGTFPVGAVPDSITFFDDLSKPGGVGVSVTGSSAPFPPWSLEHYGALISSMQTYCTQGGARPNYPLSANLRVLLEAGGVVATPYVDAPDLPGQAVIRPADLFGYVSPSLPEHMPKRDFINITPPNTLGYKTGEFPGPLTWGAFTLIGGPMAVAVIARNGRAAYLCAQFATAPTVLYRHLGEFITDLKARAVAAGGDPARITPSAVPQWLDCAGGEGWSERGVNAMGGFRGDYGIFGT